MSISQYVYNKLEFTINAAPPASNSVYGREKLFWCDKINQFQIMCVTVVQWSRRCLHLQINRVRLPATLFSASLYRFFFLFGLFFNTIFPFGLFSLFLLLTLLVHALGSIYILSLRPEFYFGKGILKALDLHTGQAYDQKKNISCQEMSLLREFFSIKVS